MCVAVSLAIVYANLPTIPPFHPEWNHWHTHVLDMVSVNVI